MRSLSARCLMLLAALAYSQAAATAESPLPPIAARFETIISGPGQQYQRYEWHFWRDRDYLEIENLAEHGGEVWTRLANGQIGYQQLLHANRQLIDYLPADLDALGARPDWQVLSRLLIAPLADMHITGSASSFSQPAVIYRNGVSNDADLLVWLTQSQLPAVIQIQHQDQRLLTRLLELYDLAQSPWPFARAGAYQSTDFADLGDKPLIEQQLHHLKNRYRH